MGEEIRSARREPVAGFLDPIMARVNTMIAAREEAAEDPILLAERAEAEWLALAAKIGVPMKLARTASMVRGRSEPALVRTRRWLDDEWPSGACLVLSGPTGVGKSFAAVAALRAMAGGRRFFYFPSLCGAWLDGDRRKEALERAETTRTAVFDDFGTEYVKRGGLLEALLDEVVWHREANDLPTIITTNLTSEELKGRLSDRIIDRLRGGWGRVFECPGESLR